MLNWWIFSPSWLQWELAKRGELGDEAKHRESGEGLAGWHHQSKEDKLCELGPQLASILSSTVPVQDYRMPPSDQREQMSLARLLPPPPYIAHTDMDVQRGLL